MSKRYTTHYIANQHQKLQYRFWVDGSVYQANDKETADWKLEQGLKVEKFNTQTQQWEEYKG